MKTFRGCWAIEQSLHEADQLKAGFAGTFAWNITVLVGGRELLVNSSCALQATEALSVCFFSLCLYLLRTASAIRGHTWHTWFHVAAIKLLHVCARRSNTVRKHLCKCVYSRREARSRLRNGQCCDASNASRGKRRDCGK